MASAPPADVLVGRYDELAVLDGLVAGLRDGRGRVVWVEGEPGIGKSALIGQVSAQAERVGCRVFQAGADELAQPLPLRLMADCLQVSAGSADRLRAEIAGLLRGRASGAADPVLAAGERMAELVDRACAADPVLLVTEDLHWADEASLVVWYQLARSVQQIPLLLVGSCRPVPRRDEVLRLRQVVEEDADAVPLRLGPLPAEQAAELAGRLVRAAPGPRLRTELAQAGGNPLYVRELVDALVRDGQVEVAAGTAELRTRTGSGPVSLTAAIGRRLRFLAEDTREVLRIAAVLGAEFSVDELATAARRPVGALVPAMEEGVAAGVLSDDGQRMLFRHDLIRRALAEEIPAPVQAALHGQLARRLADAGRPMGRIAAHLLAAADTLDGWALDWLASLAEPALYAAPQVAVELLTRAVEHAGTEDRRWQTLAGRLATALYWVDRYEQAGQVATDVQRRTADPGLAARMAWYAAAAANLLGRYDQALEVSEQALQSTTVPAVWRGRLRARSAVTLWSSGRVEEAAVRAQQALADGQHAGDGLTVGQAEFALYLVGTDWQTHLDRALAALGEDPESIQLRMKLLVNQAGALANLDRRQEYEAAVREGLMLAERAGTGLLELRMLAAEGSYEFGDWDEALVYLDGMTSPPGHHNLLVMHGLRALIAAHREDGATAAAHITEATSQVAVAEGYLRPAAGFLTAARALAAEAAGDVPAAVALLAPWLDPTQGGTDGRSWWMPDLVRLALAAGDTGTARAAAEAAEADAANDPVPVLTAAARRCRAQLDDDPAGLLAVADYYRQATRKVDLAATLEEAAVRLAAGGDVPAARAALTDAVRGYQDVGASWDIRRADSRLRPYGIRRGSRSLRRRPTTGWEALTTAEQRIAQLVAEGKSNPDIATELFLSRRTVYTHVSNILRKLDLHSRIEIARDAAQRTNLAASMRAAGSDMFGSASS